MRLKDLETYLEVIQCGSFSEAAKKIGVSQSAVSQQITALEKEFSTNLIIRGIPGVLSLTPAGELFFAHAKNIFEEYQALHNDIAVIQNSVKGSLNLGASAIPGNYLLPEIILAFREQYPDVDIRLNVANTRDITRKIFNGECEIGFIGAAREHSGYQTKVWVEDRILLAVHPNHPFAKKKSISINDLRNQPLILREEGSSTRQTIERSLSECGLPISECKVVLVLGSTQGVYNAIKKGLGIGFISSFASKTDDLVEVKIDDLLLTRNLYVVYDSERANTFLHQTFLEFIQTWPKL